MSRYAHITKPAKLDPDCAWVSIAKVEGGTGKKTDELEWRCEYIAATRHTFGELAKDAAQGWYRDTDQCGECVVTIRIEDARGQVVDIGVNCEIVTRFRATHASKLHAKVGNSIAPQTREIGGAA